LALVLTDHQVRSAPREKSNVHERHSRADAKNDDAPRSTSIEPVARMAPPRGALANFAFIASLRLTKCDAFVTAAAASASSRTNEVIVVSTKNQKKQNKNGRKAKEKKKKKKKKRTIQND
jgi:hypothetical protein